jgi:transglutaminase-like putative cysteine protease
MHIRYGYDIHVETQSDIPLITLLDVHPSARADMTAPESIEVTTLNGGHHLDDHAVYVDKFGNICRRIVAPVGGVRMVSSGMMYHSGFPDDVNMEAQAHRPEDLPHDVLMYLLGSRYCETDLLNDHACELFGKIEGGWQKVQAVCDYVHNLIKFNYKEARSTRTAAEALTEKVGVCRDFAHSAITLCRCLNIPARYSTGYLGDIGVPKDPSPMDFSAWFEVYLSGRWWTFDARHSIPRIGRIVMAYGRDATDVPIINSFGDHKLLKFAVVTEEIEEARFPLTSKERREHWEEFQSPIAMMASKPISTLSGYNNGLGLYSRS